MPEEFGVSPLEHLKMDDWGMSPVEKLHAMESLVNAALQYQEAMDAMRNDPCELTRQDAMVQCVQLLELCRAYRAQVGE